MPSSSSSSNRFDDALHLLFMELADIDSWYRDVKKEADKAAFRREALIATLRSAIETRRPRTAPPQWPACANWWAKPPPSQT